LASVLRETLYLPKAQPGVMAAATLPTRARAPQVNVSDIPEMMLGAQPGTSAVDRERFQQMCRQLHCDDDLERQQGILTAQVTSLSTMTRTEVEAMFPTLDPALVRSIYAEAPSPQAGIDTLLALGASMREPVTNSADEAHAAAKEPARDIGVEDESKFPSLTDADGWQIVGLARLEQDLMGNLGDDWAEKAKIGASAPCPAPGFRASLGAWGRPTRQKQKEDQKEDAEHHQPPTDYEYRHIVGQQRAQRHAKYGRTRPRTNSGCAVDSSHQSESKSGEEDPI